MKLKGIMFDLDGTLGETLPVCLAALRTTFRRFFERDWSYEELLSHFGPTEEGVIKRLLPERAEQCLEAYYDEYKKAHNLCPAPFPGMENALRLLRKKGVFMAIVTAKGPRTAALSLEILKLNSYFDAVEHGFEDGNKKTISIKNVLARWKILPGLVAYIGDRPSDIQAAKMTGLVPLAAAWAESADIRLLLEESPHALFSTVEEFTRWIGENTGSS